MALCGPGCSLCCTILSVWGVVQLGFMGLFYFIKAVALAPDVPVITDATYSNSNDFYAQADISYTQNAYICWVAAGIYVLTLLLSGSQFYIHSRKSNDDDD